jgi:hydroxypyruvate isomerase
MTNRRSFMTTAVTGIAALPALHSAARSTETVAALFPYAVCAETFWKDRPFADRLARIAEAGFRHFEFWKFQDKDIEAVAAACRQHHLTPVQFVAGWSMNSPERRAQFMVDLEQALAAADTLGVTMMTVIAGFEVEGASREQQTREVIETLRRAEPFARSANVVLMIEPTNVLVDHPGQLVVTSAHAAEIVRAVDSPHVRMLFDVYHQQVSEGNLSGNMRAYYELITYFQIADHPGRHEPGTGEINFAHVLRTIHELGYRKPIGLELKPKGDPLAALHAVLDADRAALSAAP